MATPVTCILQTLILTLALYVTPTEVTGALQAPSQLGTTDRVLDDAVAQTHVSRSGPDAVATHESLEQRYNRLRTVAITGDFKGSLHSLVELLNEDLPSALRIRVYSTAISLASMIEDWPQAYGLLNEAFDQLETGADESAMLLTAASFLHVLVDERELALELGHRAIVAAEASMNISDQCRTLSNLALLQERDGDLTSALRSRERQIDICTRVDDRLFVGLGKLGFGRLMAMQNRQTDALKWAKEALEEYHSVDYAAGISDAQVAIASSLIALRREPNKAKSLLDEALEYYRQQSSTRDLADTERLRAALAESTGDITGAVKHLKAAIEFAAEAERSVRERRVAYMQVHFDSKLKEQHIALLEAEKSLTELQTAATRRRQLLLVTLLGGLLAVAGLLSILLRRSFLERQHFRWKSEHDGLTHLLNHVEMRKRGEAMLKQTQAAGSALTAIAIDIDMFKQVNDYHGHAAGDAVLRAMGKWIRETVGDRGILARRGGDEFMILLDGDANSASLVLRDLRKRMHPLSVLGETVRFTISAGVCQTEPSVTTLEQLLHQADQALYQAKGEGRDRSVIAHELETRANPKSSGLVVVGSGIQFGRHASERTLSEIRRADVVFCLADSFALAMINRFRPDVVNLGTYYAPGKDRRETYRQIDDAIMAAVRADKQVCAVFYGHPGIFADVPHRVIRKAREEGYAAHMEPGISAEACLYADLGIDPGHRGVQSMETTQFLYYDRHLDPKGLVLLWQVALAGDLSCTRTHAERDGLQALTDKLRRWYPADHEVILYEAAQLPIETPRSERLHLSDLPNATYQEYTTLVVPPLGELRFDPAFARGNMQGVDSVEC